MVGYFKIIMLSCFFFSFYNMALTLFLNYFNPCVGAGGSGGAPGLGLQGQVGTGPAGGFGTGAWPVGGYGPGTVGSGFAGAGLPGSAVGAGSRGGLGPGYGTGAGGNLNQSE